MGKRSKAKVKTTKINLGGKKLIEFQTACLNKHGELKGKNKKETKILKDMCLHHKVGKKGKIKQRVNIDGANKMGHCTMCDHDFTVRTYDKESRNDVIEPYRELVDQTKYLAARVDVGEDALRSLAEAAVSIDNVKRINKKCTKIGQKKQKLKKNKSKSNSSESFGRWSTGNK